MLNANFFDGFVFLAACCILFIVVAGSIFLLDSASNMLFGYSFLEKVEKWIFRKFGD